MVSKSLFVLKTCFGTNQPPPKLPHTDKLGGWLVQKKLLRTNKDVENVHSVPQTSGAGPAATTGKRLRNAAGWCSNNNDRLGTDWLVCVET